MGNNAPEKLMYLHCEVIKINKHLYFYSKRKINCDDYTLDIRRGEIVKSVCGWKEGLWQLGGIYKVEASTDKSLDIPIIPLEFTNQWIEKRPFISEVKLSMKEGQLVKVGRGGEREVVILPMKESWTKQEVLNVAQSCWYEARATVGDTFHQFFEKLINSFK